MRGATTIASLVSISTETHSRSQIDAAMNAEPAKVLNQPSRSTDVIPITARKLCSKRLT